MKEQLSGHLVASQGQSTTLLQLMTGKRLT